MLLCPWDSPFIQARILGGLPFPSPGDLADPGIEPGSPALQADTLPTVLGLKHGKEHVTAHAQNRKQPRKGS